MQIEFMNNDSRNHTKWNSDSFPKPSAELLLTVTGWPHNHKCKHLNYSWFVDGTCSLSRDLHSIPTRFALVNGSTKLLQCIDPRILGKLSFRLYKSQHSIMMIVVAGWRPAYKRSDRLKFGKVRICECRNNDMWIGISELRSLKRKFHLTAPYSSVLWLTTFLNRLELLGLGSKIWHLWHVGVPLTFRYPACPTKRNFPANEITANSVHN